MTREAWPVTLRGITESIVTTRQPTGQWNAAALGVVASEPVRARTWGETRTRQNFDHHGAGYLQFTRDPMVFVEAAIGIHEVDEPVLPDIDAWIKISVDRLDTGVENGTEWVEWQLHPEESHVIETVVPTINRGYNAIIEATVAASRLSVDAYDSALLRDRLDDLESIVHRCGGPAERAAFNRLNELIDRQA